MSVVRETKRLAVGLASYLVPERVFAGRRVRDAGGSSVEEDARYGYSLWLRHLVTADRAGLPTDPRVVVELGPADSLGVGIAALLSGAERYRALDVLPYDVATRTLAMFEVIHDLFDARVPIPDDPEFAGVHPQPEDRSFPHHLLTPQRLGDAMSPSRLDSLRASLARVASDDADEIIRFVPDWEDPGLIPAGSVDLVLSQAVMEHVGDVEATYDAIAAWLAPGGVTSHTIDFRSHGLYEPWNGHLAVPDWRWRAMWGRRTPVLNRSLPSAHVDALSGRGLEVVVDQRIAADGGLPRSHLSPTFRSADESDLCTAVSVVQAWRPSTRPGRSVSPNA